MNKKLETIGRVTHTHTHTHTSNFSKELVVNTRFFVMCKYIKVAISKQKA